MPEDYGPAATAVPEDFEDRDLLEHWWYCSTKGWLIIEPSETQGKEACWVLPINTELTATTEKKAGKKREIVFCQTHWLDKKHYKKWTKSEKWPEKKEVRDLFDQVPQDSMVVIKSKEHFFLFTVA